MQSVPVGKAAAEGIAQPPTDHYNKPVSNRTTNKINTIPKVTEEDYLRITSRITCYTVSLT